MDWSKVVTLAVAIAAGLILAEVGIVLIVVVAAIVLWLAMMIM